MRFELCFEKLSVVKTDMRGFETTRSSMLWGKRRLSVAFVTNIILKS